MDHRLAIDELFIILVNITTTAVAPVIDWVVVPNALEVSAVSEDFAEFELVSVELLEVEELEELLEVELLEVEVLEVELLEDELLSTTHIPMVKLYPVSHWAHTKLLVSEHVSQFEAIQFFYSNFDYFLNRRSYSRNCRLYNKSEISVSRKIRRKKA